MSQEKISCFISLGPPPMRKSPVSCLMRKSCVSWEILMPHAFSINPKRKSLETWDFLMRQETGDFLVGGLYDKISYLMRKSHVFSVLGPTPMRKSPVSSLRRKSHVPRENLMSFHFWVPPTRKSPVSCLMRKSLVARENLMTYQFGIPPPNKKSSVFYLMR